MWMLRLGILIFACKVGLIIIIHYLVMMSLSPTNITTNKSPNCFDLKSETSTEGEENDFIQDYGCNFAARSPFRNGCSKAKTSLCKNFTEKGYCSYGKKCQFAHGPEELRVNMEHNRSYKTKGCHAFAKKGYCHYGERCNFIHEQVHEQSEGERWSMMYSNHRETINPSEFLGSSRLLNLLRE